MPRTLIQAVAAGIPIVASRADGVTDLVGRIEGSALFDPGDVESASNQVIAVLDGDPPTSRASEDVLVGYDASEMVTRLCDLYTSLP